MKGKLLGFALALFAVATIGVVQLQTKAYVDGDPDCDKYAVIWCGSYSPAATKNAILHGAKNSPNLAKIFNALGIQASEIGGTYKPGIVYQNGNVVVGGKVVAKNARMAARNLGGSPIAGTNAGVMSVSHMGSAQTAMVKFDSNGRFVHAIMKPCGNPVAATPTQPKPVAKCDKLNVEKIERTKFKFVGHATVKYGAKVKAYKFTVHKGSKVIASKRVDSSAKQASWTYTQETPGDYRVRVTVITSEGEKNSADCMKKFTVQEKPVAACKVLTVETINRTKFKFTAKADVTRATVKGYDFKVYKDGALVDTKSVKTDKLSASVNYTQATAGDYTVKAIVKTSLGDRTGAKCEKPFTVPPKEVESHPGVKVEKTVSADGENFEEHVVVGVGVEYSYKLVVTNTGDVTLNNVKVTDTPAASVTLNTTQSVGTVTGNVWTYVIPTLKVGESKEFILKATVPEYKAGNIKNTVCVDAGEVPGNPDDCDDATVEVPKKVYVCDPETGEIIKVDEDEADNYVPVDSDECKDIVVCNLETHEIETIKKSEYDESIHTTDLSKCKEGNQVPVCNPETGEIIKVDESEADDYLPVDSDECKTITVCDRDSNTIVTIKKSEYDESKHTTNLSECQETPPVTPPTTPEMPGELPETGVADLVVKLAGVSSLAGAGSYYLISRRNRA